MMNRSRFQDLWDSIAGRGKQIVSFDQTPKPSRQADAVALSHALISGRGEASGVKLASALLDAYGRMDTHQRLAYLTALSQDFGPDAARLDAAIAAYLADKSQQTMAELSAASEPLRQEVLRRINHAPGGTAALVRMREDLLGHLATTPALAVLDSDFSHLFSSWFNRGFLQLRRIDWTTPANILAKIIRYEAVHTISSWDDLRNRLEPPDRRCFAFFHPQMPEEPLVFVEVALTGDIPDAIGPLLELEREPLAAADATTAVFYSISNCQIGLKGVSFGNFLIKQVVEDLKRDLPRLSTFVTLSPVPGFLGWLRKSLAAAGPPAFAPDVAAALASLASEASSGPPDEALRKAQLAAGARYFLNAKTATGRPVDPVARFHLGNGARLERLNFRGDLSGNGLRQSAGLMVNYLYDLAAIETNHEAYADKGIVAASKAVRNLLADAERAA